MAPTIVLDNLPLQTEIEQIANRLPVQAKDLIPNAADLAMTNDFIKHMQQAKNEMQNAVPQPPNDRVRIPIFFFHLSTHSAPLANVDSEICRYCIRMATLMKMSTHRTCET